MNPTDTEVDWRPESRKSVKHALIALSIVVVYSVIDIVFVGGPSRRAYASLALWLAALGFFTSLVGGSKGSTVTLRVIAIALFILFVVFRFTRM